MRIRSGADGDNGDGDGDGDDDDSDGDGVGDGDCSIEALRQVGWLHQRQHRSFHRLRAFY